MDISLAGQCLQNGNIYFCGRLIFLVLWVDHNKTFSLWWTCPAPRSWSDLIFGNFFTLAFLQNIETHPIKKLLFCNISGPKYGMICQFSAIYTGAASDKYHFWSWPFDGNKVISNTNVSEEDFPSGYFSSLCCRLLQFDQRPASFKKS